jgi:hypothetical protein
VIEERDSAGALLASYASAPAPARSTSDVPTLLDFAFDGEFIGGALPTAFSPGSKSFRSLSSAGDLPERLDGMETGSFSMRRGGQDYWLPADDAGNVLAVTDAAGTIIERYDYDDYGEVQLLNPAGGPITGATQSAAGNPYLFRGLRYESEPRFFLLGGTTGKYPEYHKVWEDGALRAVSDLRHLLGPASSTCYLAESRIRALPGSAQVPLIHQHSDFVYPSPA